MGVGTNVMFFSAVKLYNAQYYFTVNGTLLVEMLLFGLCVNAS